MTSRCKLYFFVRHDTVGRIFPPEKETFVYLSEECPSPTLSSTLDTLSMLTMPPLLCCLMYVFDVMAIRDEIHRHIREFVDEAPR